MCPIVPYMSLVIVLTMARLVNLMMLSVSLYFYHFMSKNYPR